ncbi:GntR family transcriptional regulator [Mycolicibacterium sp. 120266]|uniref:GntR family transcriptional regulator n=1 Tax=Mycolicibacterium sp. 120266 TaxID=3090601 RepID=UPI00299D4101|nr:GntR family transcriptional regulator [Mycolicibacterium sp. 120266]MDX1874619.1 GntR family transcriptional regulator [Mycolicibacterium sp. 120266]
MSIASEPPSGRAERRGEPEFVDRPQLSDDVARVVRRRIFHGTYPAGVYLRLDQLAADLGISVTPVREALLNLRAEGLLVQHPRRGFMVLEVTARDIADVANLQAYIGGELGARAAATITDEQVAELTAIQDALEKAYEHHDLDRTVRLNHEFHRLINVIADSPKLTQMMSVVTRYAPESVFPTMEGWPAQSIRDHRTVIDALQRRDGDMVRAAMAEHFTIGVRPMTEHLTQRGVIRPD